MAKRIDNKELNEQAFNIGDELKIIEGIAIVTYVYYQLNYGFRYYLTLKDDDKVVRCREQVDLLKKNKPTVKKQNKLLQFMGDKVYLLSYDEKRCDPYILDGFNRNKRVSVFNFKNYDINKLRRYLIEYTDSIKKRIDDESKKIKTLRRKIKESNRALEEMGSLDLSVLNVSDILMQEFKGVSSRFENIIEFSQMEMKSVKSTMTNLVTGYYGNLKMIDKLRKESK